MRPDWLKVRIGDVTRVSGMLEDLKLNTVCEGASCPNLGDCFKRGRATFLLLGRACTRSCRFCAMGATSSPSPLDSLEPRRVAEAVMRLGLRAAVITSVTRDDLPDGGAGCFAETAERIKKNTPSCSVEALVPDFLGQLLSIERVCSSPIDLFCHNLETVRRLSPNLRGGASYERSLAVLEAASLLGKRTKSGLMLGLGESEPEILDSLADLRKAGCREVTLGQYLPPTPDHPPPRYIDPSVFKRLAGEAFLLGFDAVAAGPLVRSSYA